MMKGDYQSYRRATSVAALGLGLQLLLGLALLIYSVLGGDSAAFAGSLLVLSGSIVWLTLIIVFDQHRRERVELLEHEALAAGGARESSVFGERADDLRVAARRLAWMHKFMVPAVSLLFAAVLISLGALRLSSGRVALSVDEFTPTRLWGVGFAIGLALAVVGFIFARFVSGMGKQTVWNNLRGGAAQAVGAALTGLALAASLFVNSTGTDTLVRGLEFAIGVAMIVLGIEVVLNFVLGIYRPRRAGEIPRPPMDSRILGFVAAPDRLAESIGGALDYQFGFSVTRSWFYQLLQKSLLILLLLGLGVMWLMTTVAVVQPNEQALRIRSGRQVGEVLGPGAYFKLPWPLERVERVDATSVRRLDLGADTPKISGAILWTNDHGGGEKYFAVQPSVAERSAERRGSPAVGSGTAAGGTGSGGAREVVLLVAEIPLLYSIRDLKAFDQFAAPDKRDELLRAIARREVVRYMATQPVDAVLGAGRGKAAEALRGRVQARFDEVKAGVEVLFVGIEGVHPPRETGEAFEAVVRSGQKRQSAIEAGRGEADRLLIETVGSVELAGQIVDRLQRLDGKSASERAELADTQRELEELMFMAGGTTAELIQEARADRWTTHMRQRGRAELYAGQLAGYKANPLVFASGLYFETLSAVLGQARVYVVADGGAEVEVRLDLQDSKLSGNALIEGEKPADE